MPRTSSLLAWTLSATVALGSLGCGHQFRNAMERGDALAQAGDWDAAAASYETALRHKPDSPEARARLRQARSKQAARRVAASRDHLARGELALAVVAARAALTLDPESHDARAAYEEARGQALARAEALLTEDKARDALELARAVRRSDPRDPRAADIEGRCLDHIASHAYDRAVAYIGQKKLGNALLALREVEEARPGYRDAAARADATRSALEEEIRFILVVERATGASQNSLRTRVEESLLRWSPDSRFRLSTATDRDPPAGAQAVRIQPKLGDIAQHHEVQTVGRSCDYVCGVDRVPNPAYDVASRRSTEAERRMRAADGAVARANRAVDQAGREVASAARAHEAASSEASRALAERDRCIFNKKPGESCTSEEARYSAAARARDAASSREQGAKDARSRAESDARDAERERESARGDWDASLRDLRSTPVTITVDRVCTHNYGVEVHTFSGAVSLALHVHVLGEPEAVDVPPTSHMMSSTDETFPSQPGRCAEVAAGDPLHTPSEAEVEANLAARVVEKIQTYVAGWYAGYVESYRTDYEAAKAAGRMEDANEAYVRYLLVGPGWRGPR